MGSATLTSGGAFYNNPLEGMYCFHPPPTWIQAKSNYISLSLNQTFAARNCFRKGRTAAEVAAATAATLNTLMATTSNSVEDKKAVKVRTTC